MTTTDPAELIVDAEATIAALGGTNPATVDDLAAQRDTWETTARQLAAAGTGRLADASEAVVQVTALIDEWLRGPRRDLPGLGARIVAALGVDRLRAAIGHLADTLDPNDTNIRTWLSQQSVIEPDDDAEVTPGQVVDYALALITDARTQVDLLTRDLAEVNAELEATDVAHGRDMEHGLQEHIKYKRLREGVRALVRQVETTVYDGRSLGIIAQAPAASLLNAADRLRALLDGADTPASPPSATETAEPAPARVEASTEPQTGAETALTAPTGQPPAYYVPADVVEGQQAEIARLRAEVKRLSARVREWEAVNADLAERCDSGDIPIRLGERYSLAVLREIDRLRTERDRLRRRLGDVLDLEELPEDHTIVAAVRRLRAAPGSTPDTGSTHG